MAEQPLSGAPRRARLIAGILIAGGVVVLLVIMWHQLPRPYSTDLDLIGQGTPALVLAHDDHLVNSDQQMAAMDNVREGLERHAILLVAHMREARGASFAREHDADAATVLIFSADGELLARIRGPVDGPALRQHVASVLDTSDEDPGE